MGAFVSGFLTNALNPKTMLFVVSAYSQVVQPGPRWGSTLPMGRSCRWRIGWFSLVALFFSREALRQAMLRRQRMVDRVIRGGVDRPGVAVVFVNVR
ncbi:LysE family transporter [Pseudomonas qingdaonensis]|nr:LysE family transporter [Pseudomonas qingdaonensis]